MKRREGGQKVVVHARKPDTDRAEKSIDWNLEG